MISDIDDKVEEDNEEVDSDAESVDEENGNRNSAIQTKNLASTIIEIWKKRRRHLRNDYTVAGWLLCPSEEVMLNAKSSKKAEDDEAMECVIDKLYHHMTEDERGQVQDIFWTE